MKVASRPLRAVTLVMGGWFMVRATFIWPIQAPASPAQTSQLEVPCACGRTVSIPITLGPLLNIPLDSPSGDDKPEQSESLATDSDTVIGRSLVIELEQPRKSEKPVILAIETSSQDQIKPSHPPPEALAAEPVAPPLSKPPIRMSVSAWGITRGGRGSAALAQGGELGGSQAGARAKLFPWHDGTLRHLGLTARISAPLAKPLGKEASVGLVWRLADHIPVDIFVERRIALDRGGRNDFSIMAAGGVNDIRLPMGWAFDAYGQAGFVGLKRREAFADGAVRLEHEIWRHGSTRFAFGGGVWGAVQPGVARLDVGPQAVLHFSTGKANFRLSAEWRQRIAGHARPASGPAVSIGTDF
jgi:hypothetical protein